MKDSRRIVAQLAVAVMAADGKITRSEVDIVSQLRGLGLGDISPFLQEELERATVEPIDPDRAAAAIGKLAPEVAAIVITALAEIAAADGVLAPNEMKVLRIVGRRLGMPDAETEHVVEATVSGHGARIEGTTSDQPGPTAKSAPPPKPDPKPAGAATAPTGNRAVAARILGVREDGSRQDIEAAYRRAIEMYEPQRVIDLGPEFAVLAVRRLQTATDAFQILMASAE